MPNPLVAVGVFCELGILERLAAHEAKIVHFVKNLLRKVALERWKPNIVREDWETELERDVLMEVKVVRAFRKPKTVPVMNGIAAFLHKTVTQDSPSDASSNKQPDSECALRTSSKLQPVNDLPRCSNQLWSDEPKAESDDVENEHDHHTFKSLGLLPRDILNHVDTNKGEDSREDSREDSSAASTPMRTSALRGSPTPQQHRSEQRRAHFPFENDAKLGSREKAQPSMEGDGKHCNKDANEPLERCNMVELAPLDDWLVALRQQVAALPTQEGSELSSTSIWIRPGAT